MSPESYFYPWQNKNLRDTIYPFREMKLRDFLLIYEEIDLWAKMKGKSPGDPSIAARIKTLRQKAQQEHDQIAAQLNTAIENRKQTDTWFARITGRDENNLRFKQVYYLDRSINDQTERQAELIARQKSLLRRLDWYKEGDPRRQTWKGRAAELDAPLAAVDDELGQLSKIRELFDKQDRLPKLEPDKPLTAADLARSDLNDYEKSLESKTHDELVEMVWKRLTERLLNAQPRFEKWFQYMIIHFSGMRYISSHGSWADPNELLELLVRDDLKDEIKPGEDIDDKVEQEMQRLLRAPADASTKDLLPVLKALVLLKNEKANSPDPLPDWVWQEIQKFTQLRLGTTDPNWEAISPERWQFENRRWRELMDSWQRKDITSWRQKHAETLDLIVTRAVCNEIAEHIQHLRGITPPGGLTAKPRWYLNAQNKLGDKGKAYFRRPTKDVDFTNGGSIFWMGWVPSEPNAWQVAHPLPGIDILGGKRVVDGRTKDSNDWNVRSIGDTYIRTRRPDVRIPSVQELRKQGLTDREIEKKRQELRGLNAVEKQYLRWKHEATVVDVVERIDGPYVLTFETGKIGLNWHTLGNMVNNPVDEIFVGFVPKADKEPENLAGMLDPAKILAKVAPPAPASPPVRAPAPAAAPAMAGMVSFDMPVMADANVPEPTKIKGWQISSHQIRKQKRTA